MECEIFLLMAVCNFCNITENRARKFNLPFTCKDCEMNPDNYMNTQDDDNNITFIDGSGKKVVINSDTEFSILENKDEGDKPFDTNNIKDALLASLYSQVEFLKSQLEKKDLIRTLIIKDNETHTQIYKSASISTTISTVSGDDVASNDDFTDNFNERDDGIMNISVESNIDNSTNEDDDNNDEELQNLFRELHLQFEQQNKSTFDTQLQDYRTEKNNKYQKRLEKTNNTIEGKGCMFRNECPENTNADKDMVNNDRNKAGFKHQQSLLERLTNLAGYNPPVDEKFISARHRRGNKDNNKHVRTSVIIGDSMIRNIKGKKLANKLAKGIC